METKEKLNIYEKLSNIQNELKAPKGQYNSFGKYNYRSAEDILEAVKPICNKYRTTLVLSDELIVKGEHNLQSYIENIWDKDAKQFKQETKFVGGQRYYVEATATLYDLDSDKCVVAKADAREEETKKGMDGSQITGTASSYARKYALNGLFNIDDTKDADTDEFAKQIKGTTKKEVQKEVEQRVVTSLVTDKQKEMIKSLYTNEEIRTYFKSFGKSKLSELTVKEASDFIKQKEKKGEN